MTNNQSDKHSGRPAKDGATGLKRVAVLLTAEQIERATELGHGVLSLGVRRAIDAAKTEYPPTTP